MVVVLNVLNVMCLVFYACVCDLVFAQAARLMSARNFISRIINQVSLILVFYVVKELARLTAD